MSTPVWIENSILARPLASALANCLEVGGQPVHHRRDGDAVDPAVTQHETGRCEGLASGELISLLGNLAGAKIEVMDLAEGEDRLRAP